MAVHAAAQVQTASRLDAVEQAPPDPILVSSVTQGLLPTPRTGCRPTCRGAVGTAPPASGGR